MKNVEIAALYVSKSFLSLEGSSFNFFVCHCKKFNNEEKSRGNNDGQVP